MKGTAARPAFSSARRHRAGVFRCLISLPAVGGARPSGARPQRGSVAWADVTSTDPEYFSDSQSGHRAPVLDELPPEAWTGISATFHRFLELHFFGAELPEQCDDGKGICGTSRAGVLALLRSHIPELGDWPREHLPPSTLTAMDLVEFGWRHVQEPSVRNHHSYFDHDHYSFDQSAGRRRWRNEINIILDRNGVALRLEPGGRVIRIGTMAAQVLTQSPVPATGDIQLDDKITTALRKYHDPDVGVRREALEALWDAFERVKTILPGDKKRSATALVDLVTADEPARQLLGEEFAALTSIGNRYQIRHHETDRHQVDDAIIDLLFARALALIETAVRALPDGSP